MTPKPSVKRPAPKERKKLTPYQRIMHAAKRGTGMRLSADEAFALSMDDAIASCAINDDEAQGR